MELHLEALENRRLFSTVTGMSLPADGSAIEFSGIIHLRYHNVGRGHGASISLPVSLALAEKSAGVVSGVETVGSQSPAGFLGTIDGRLFSGTFADGSGSISGVLARNSKSVKVALSLELDGEIITGKYSARRPGGATLHRAAQTGQSNSSSAGSTAAGSAANEMTFTTTAAIGRPAFEAPVPIMLSSLDTSLASFDSLNPATTAAGVVTANQTLYSTLPNNNSPGQSITLPNNIGSLSTTGNGLTVGSPAGTNTSTTFTTGFTFSANSGIVTIAPTGTTTTTNGTI